MSDSWQVIYLACTDTSEGKKVIHDIIPAMVKLRGLFEIELSTMLSPEILEAIDEPVAVKSSDLKATDDLFDSLEFEWV